MRSWNRHCFFSGEHQPVKWYMRCNTIRLFPRLFVSGASPWLCTVASCLASHNWCVVPRLSVGSLAAWHSLARVAGGNGRVHRWCSSCIFLGLLTFLSLLFSYTTAPCTLANLFSGKKFYRAERIVFVLELRGKDLLYSYLFKAFKSLSRWWATTCIEIMASLS